MVRLALISPTAVCSAPILGALAQYGQRNRVPQPKSGAGQCSSKAADTMTWRKRLALAFCAASIALLSWAASANDSVAEMSAGGLVLRESADIEMRSEDLFISSEQVRVDY